MLEFHRFAESLDDWGRIVDDFSDAEVFQIPAWLQFIAASQNATPEIAVLKEGEETLGYFAGLTIRKMGVKILGSPFVGWTTDFMGVRLLRETPKRPVMQALSEYAFNTLGCMHVEFADRCFSPDDVDGLGFDCDQHRSYLVDLTPDEDVIYQGMSSKSCRYEIRKAMKAGVTIEEASDDAFADEYYAQLEDVFAKQGLVPTYGKDRVRLLIKHLQPTGNLLLLRARSATGACIATGIFLGYKKYAYFWGNASWRRDQHLSPNESIHWYAMRYWKRRGMQLYDFCGAGDYKRKYGGQEVPRFILRKSRYSWIATARGLAFRAFRANQKLAGWRKGSRSETHSLGTQPIASHGDTSSGQRGSRATITIERYTEAMCAEVARFNSRLKERGGTLSLPASHIPAWLPEVAGRRLFQEQYLALDEGRNVRGGYTLKHGDFWIAGRVVPIGDIQLPLSEGTIDKAYSLVGIQMLFDALKRQPLLHGLGIGASDESFARLLVAARWKMHPVPFFFRVIRPVRFLRNIVYLRRSAPRRWALDLMAYSGIGWLGIKALQYARTRRSRHGPMVRSEIVEDFSDWVDELWERHKADYGMVAVRDGKTLSALYARRNEEIIIVKVLDRDTPIGWAVLLNTHWANHKQLGNVQLGSIVDCFSAKQDAASVVRCATETLERRGVDLIVSNQCHASWWQALQSSGYLQGPSNFVLAMSPELDKMRSEAKIGLGDIHVNRGDGDGPVNL